MTTILTVLTMWLLASIPVGIVMGRMLKRAAASQTTPVFANAEPWSPSLAPGASLARRNGYRPALARTSLDR